MKTIKRRFCRLIFVPISGLLSAVHPTREALLSAAFALASEIASKSPVAVQGTKVVLNYSQDHTVSDSLNFVVGPGRRFENSGDLEHVSAAQPGRPHSCDGHVDQGQESALRQALMSWIRGE